MEVTFQVVDQHLQKPVGRQSWAALLTQRDPTGVPYRVAVLGSPNLRRTHLNVTKLGTDCGPSMSPG